MNHKEVQNILSTVKESPNMQDLVSLGRVQDIDIKDQKINITLAIPTGDAQTKETLIQNINAALYKEYPEADVHVHFATAPKGSAPSSLPQMSIPGVHNLIAVASGKGGVGKSSVATNLTTALALQGHSVGLLDADIYGPSVPLMMGIRDQRPMMSSASGQNKIIPIESHGVKIISIGNLIDEKQAVLWRGPMASSALKQFVTDVEWGTLDYLVLDLPPGTGDIHLTLLQNFPISGGLVVTTPQKVATSDTRKGIMMFETPPLKIPILGLVENMSYFIPPDAPDKKYYLFGEGEGRRLADQFEIPLLAQIPIYQDIQKSGDLGSPAVLNAQSPARDLFLELAQKVSKELSALKLNQI